MPRTLASSRVKLALLAVGVGSVGTLGLTLLPSLAQPGPEQSTSSSGFHPVGATGALPKHVPRLQSPDAPPSTAERGYAIYLAQQAMPTGSRDVLGNPGGEVLGADLPPLGDRSSRRRIAVSIYDYSTDRLNETLIDLTNKAVVRSREVSGLQLPPTVAETSVATQLALAANPSPAFSNEYLSVTGAPLVAAEQVKTIAGVWSSTNHADETSGRAQACGENRCLQLLFALPSGQYLSTFDFVVDLSSRTVISLAHKGSEHRHEH